jgi:hypothetical protein
MLSEEEFVRLWMMGISSERSIGRPRDFDGAQSNAEDFFAKFTNWLAGMPGDVEVMLEDVEKRINEITREHMDARQ